MGGGGGGSGPTKQQTDLETQQATQQAGLDSQENERRKRLLLATQGTRMFRGSALTTAAGANSAANGNAAAGPSGSQQRPINPAQRSVFDGAGQGAGTSQK